ncbi:helix-turn-helix domain-containing protein [Rudanella paleaurantiibacter]|uniref:Helix-turn-helix domain-containing protein n=1 Tax=Rudanella paleaurantiibacter TaxID=2614655 RepID=A0A7J5TZF0_9BACT|nr:AraC family transcriptional regulator [Rudanella paleaurantiibacter]KAB7729276.1 helix-turn-helix domain-containing protein [Rudanella paleaurantiibacter]
MKLAVLISDTNQVLTELPPSRFNGCYDPESGPLVLPLPQGGEVSVQAVTLRPGVLLMWGSYAVRQPTQLRISGEQATIGLHFVQTGALALRGQNTPAPLRVAANQHVVWFDNTPEIGFDLSPTEPSRTVSVYMLPAIFSQLTGRRPSATETGQLRAGQLITATMHTVLEQITDCAMSGAVRRLFLEAKAMELLALQLRSYDGSDPQPAPTEAPHPDTPKLHEVLALLQDQYTSPPTLGELSRAVGLNEYKLKKGFKQLFNDSIYGWVLNYRLERAYELLKTGQHSVSEVAYTVGYQHPAHFTTAFRKKYGMPPREVGGAGALPE